jgi:mRNA-degrading endonuclease toxin of MazEF toxin-antitoxin module
MPNTRLCSHDEVRTIDRSQRMFDVTETVSAGFLAEVRGRLAALLGIPIDQG